jgi:hypothetical protein
MRLSYLKAGEGREGTLRFALPTLRRQDAAPNLIFLD